MDRASDSDSESRGFDSLHAYLFFDNFSWGCNGFDIIKILNYDASRKNITSLKNIPLK